MSTRLGGRDRFRREGISSRYEEPKRNPNPNSNPPSRHLWVGNLPQGISETDVTYHFSRFGELESVAFQSGRSYAFLNYREPEDAISALKSLQGFPLAGNPLRIEFAKADKSSAPLRDEDYSKHRDEQRSSTSRGSPFSQRDTRVRETSPDQFHLDKSKMSDRNAEPSQVLWIGFPALLKVDEMILRKAFSPFGEIEKITAFPGRSYAFVRFKSINSAYRAKETLQGKLFGNPRVHICFARSEAGASSGMRTPLSPRSKPNARLGFFEDFRQERDIRSFPADLNIRSPRFVPDFDRGDSDFSGFRRKSSFLSGEEDSFDNWRFEEELGPPPPDEYERLGTPIRDRGAQFREIAPRFTQKVPLYEEPWDLPEDSYLFRDAKKLKTSSYPPDRELPEYPFSDVEEEKHPFHRGSSDFPRPMRFDKIPEPGSFGYRPIQERQIDMPPHSGERSDHWKGSYDDSLASPGSLRPTHAEERRYIAEPEKSTKKLWKWEGTIAKGGTPVCRASCFPVGKAMDFMLPEFLDCTARTGLDMLAKHYYQSTSAWVVFFVADDADIGYYNEFMHYLEEKQRAAVAKLDDRTTLFLVPPSEFSEKVLKVPGNMCISGVVLRLENQGLSSRPIHLPNDWKETNLVSGDALLPKMSAPSSHFPSMKSFADSGRMGGEPSSLGIVKYPPDSAYSGSTHSVGSTSDSFHENRQGYSLHHRDSGPSWPPHHPSDSNSGNRNVPLTVPSNVGDPGLQEPDFAMPRTVQETKHTGPSSMSVAGLQPQQLAQLASSLLGQLKQPGGDLNVSMGNSSKTNTSSQSDNQLRPTQTYSLQNNRPNSEMPASKIGSSQSLPQQQKLNVSSSLPAQKEIQPGVQGNPQMHGTGTQDEADGDPQKRLQATLQLAAALLQQIQQGKGT